MVDTRDTGLAGAELELDTLPARPVSAFSREDSASLHDGKAAFRSDLSTGPSRNVDNLSLDFSPDDSRNTSWAGTLRRSSVTTNVSSLPPTDRGRQAYQFLAASTIVETVLWGLSASYGVFNDYYRTHGIRGVQASPSMIALVSAAVSGLMYLFGPPVAIALNPRPWMRPYAIWSGYIISSVSLLASSWCTTAWQLLFTQGILFSIGGALMYYPSFSYLTEWWVDRRGFANGVCFSGTALGGLIYPFVFDVLLRKVGGERALQILAVSQAVLIGVALPFVRPRLPVTRVTAPSSREHVRPSRRSNMYKNSRFYMFLGSSFLQSIGWFSPNIYLPSYATALGLSSTAGSILLACINSTGLFSRIAIGVLSDRMDPHLIGAVVAGASALTVFLLWGVAATSFGPLIAFALTLGVVSGGSVCMWTTIIREVTKEDPILGQTLFGLGSFARGLGSLVTTPISSLLLQKPFYNASSRTGYGAAGGSYGPVVVFAGTAFVVAACCEGAAMLTKRKLGH